LEGERDIFTNCVSAEVDYEFSRGTVPSEFEEHRDLDYVV